VHELKHVRRFCTFRQLPVTNYAERNWLHHPAPILKKYGTTWLYFFLTRRPVTFLSFNDNGQTTHTEFISGTGQLRNTTGCYITSDDVQTFSELHGTSQTNIEPTKLYLPEKILIMADYEVQQLQEILPLQLQKLDKIHAQTTGIKRTFYLDSLVHVHHTSLLHSKQTHWNLIITVSIFIVTS